MSFIIEVFIEMFAEAFFVIYDQTLGKVRAKNLDEVIDTLKQHEWFQDYLKNEAYEPLIASDRDVRRVIAKFKLKKLQNESYVLRCQRRLYKILSKKMYAT